MKLSLLSLFLLIFGACAAQDTFYTKKTIQTLCSPKMYGRGYVNNGDVKASNFIANQFKTIGLTAFENNYFQEFPISVNVFPSQMEIIYNGKLLIPGIDYIVDPSCPSVNFKGLVNFVSAMSIDSVNHYDQWGSHIQSAVIDTFNPRIFIDAAINYKHYTSDSRHPIIFKLSNEKLTWSSSQKQSKVPMVILNYKLFDQNKKGYFEVKIKSDLLKNHHSRNVIGYIEGSKFKDSFIYVTAHYDHLGMMGKETYFPGANDNASGIAMMLNLAKHFKENMPKYSMVFIAFSGEENGLIGSHYYVENPYTALSTIKFLVNIDLMGNGTDGVMAVNGSIYPIEFECLKSINNKEKYLPEIKARGKAANSDHYWFSQSGVPSFFFYLMGPYPYYHDVNDKASALPLSNFSSAFNLFKDFITTIQN